MHEGGWFLWDRNGFQKNRPVLFGQTRPVWTQAGLRRPGFQKVAHPAVSEPVGEFHEAGGREVEPGGFLPSGACNGTKHRRKGVFSVPLQLGGFSRPGLAGCLVRTGWAVDFLR